MKKLFLCTFAFALIASNTSSFSQDVEEIVVKGKVLYSDQVTALKTPVPIIDVPQTLSIVTDDEIRKQGFRELGDIVRYTPGVNTSQGEGHRDSIVFRGVRSTADFYLDGVRDDVQYYRSLYNLEQVEILRGPNALLFGRGGTGGIINRVTKKAVLDEQFGSFDKGADSFGAFDFAVDYNVSTGEKSALRINFHSDTLENHRDYFDGDRYGFNPTLRLELSPVTTLDLSYEHADHERFIDRGVPTLNGEPVEAFEEIEIRGIGIQGNESMSYVAQFVVNSIGNQNISAEINLIIDNINQDEIEGRETISIILAGIGILGIVYIVYQRRVE